MFLSSEHVSWQGPFKLCDVLTYVTSNKATIGQV